MNTEELLDYDDLGDALREGRALRPARGYRFLVTGRLIPSPDPTTSSSTGAVRRGG